MADQASQGLLSPWLQRARLDEVRPHLRGNVLDIGCANGALAASVAPERYLGVDHDAASLAIARERYPQHRFAGALPTEGQFDTIVAAAVIEHISAPAEALRQWAGRLAPGGQVVLTTPHKLFHIVHEVGSHLGLFSHDAAEEHEVMFDKGSLGQCATDAGLSMRLYKRFLFGGNQLAVLTRA